MSSNLVSTAIVVVNYGSHELLRSNLLPVTTGPDAPRAVVVDNWSSPEERRAITALASEVGWATVLPEANEGFGRGVNLGVRAALDGGADRVLILNPDATLDRASLNRLVDAVSMEPWTAVAPLIVDGDGRSVFWGYRVDLTDGAVRSPRAATIAGHRHEDWLTGACLAVSRELWEATGGMAEDYFLYWEDVDFSLRVRQAGGRLVNDTKAVARHVEGGTQTGHTDVTRHSSGYYYWNVRNRLRLGAHWARREELRRWVVRTPQESWAILMRGGRRQMATHPGLTILPMLRGARDGLRDVHRIRFGRR